MKRLLFCVLTIALLTKANAQTDSFNLKYNKNGTYHFDDGIKIRHDEVFTSYKLKFGLGNDDNMVKTFTDVLEDGKFMMKYQQYHKGYKVEGAFMNIIGQHGIVEYITGKVITNLNINSTIVSENVALQSALNIVGATKYSWEDTIIAVEDLEDTLENYKEYFKLPKGELLITKKFGFQNANASDYNLAYKFQINAIEPIEKFVELYMNANTAA